MVGNAANSQTLPFADRNALVTGGAKGIGRACSLALARGGATVAVNYLSSKAAAEETAREIESLGGKCHLIKADVSSQQDVQSMVAEIGHVLGPIDLLVNNAGIFDLVSHEATTSEIWQRTLDVNLTGAYYVTWAVKPSMIERRFGRIVNVASVAGLRARPMSIAYAVSKAGMISLTKCTAEALAPHNIRVNAVAPGLIDTEIIAGVEQAKLDAILDATPIRRLGKPEEIAEVVCFLLSEASSFMTGQTIVASGGRVTLP